MRLAVDIEGDHCTLPASATSCCQLSTGKTCTAMLRLNEQTPASASCSADTSYGRSLTCTTRPAGTTKLRTGPAPWVGIATSPILTENAPEKRSLRIANVCSLAESK